MNSDKMSCTQAATILDLYLDGELRSEEMRALDAHLRGCPSCAADALAWVQMRRAVQAAGKSFSPSEEFRKRVRRSIAEKPASSWRLGSWSMGWRWALAGGVATAALLVGTVLPGYFSRARRGEEARVETYREIADLHVATLASATPADVISTDRHTVKPWFQGRIPFAFNLPDLQDSGFSLLGGRLAYLQQAPGAHLIYELRKHKVSVFIFQARAGDPVPYSILSSTTSFATESWSQDGLRYFVVGDTTPDDIHKLAELFKNTPRG